MTKTNPAVNLAILCQRMRDPLNRKVGETLLRNLNNKAAPGANSIAARVGGFTRCMLTNKAA